MGTKLDKLDTIKKERHITAEKKQKFLEALAVDRVAGNVLVAANIVGIERSTIYFWKNNDQEFAKKWYETVNEAVEKRADLAEDKLEEAVRQGNITAIIFTLKTLRPEKWGNKSGERYHSEYLYTPSPAFKKAIDHLL